MWRLMLFLLYLYIFGEEYVFWFWFYIIKIRHRTQEANKSILKFFSEHRMRQLDFKISNFEQYSDWKKVNLLPQRKKRKKYSNPLRIPRKISYMNHAELVNTFNRYLLFEARIRQAFTCQYYLMTYKTIKSKLINYDNDHFKNNWALCSTANQVSVSRCRPQPLQKGCRPWTIYFYRLFNHNEEFMLWRFNPKGIW